MSEQIITILKRKLDNLSAFSNINVEIRRNILKEELHFYILNFIYHHPQYSKWIMYGGSALRIIHGLDRMSVDLDFEISQTITKKFLEDFKNEIENYFVDVYGADADFLTIKIVTGRGLLLRFHVGKELSLNSPSNQVHVKIDLNYFVVPKTVVTERRPINHDQFSFVILTYNMGALMASKLVAIFLRGLRGVGYALYEEKGRDIYDLLWYMGKRIIPDFDYMKAKGVNFNNPRTLFNKLTLQINKVSEENLKNDLAPLFLEQMFISNWLENWRESYFGLLNDYKIHTIKELENIKIYQNFNNDIISFTYWFRTDDNNLVRVIYRLSDFWMESHGSDLSIEIDKEIKDKINFSENGASSQPIPQEKLEQYATLFYQKTEKYFQKTSRVILGDIIITKLIRITANNFNPKEHIMLNKSTLLSCELDDLLK